MGSRQTLRFGFVVVMGCCGLVPAAQAQSGCGLDARNRQNVPLPVLGVGAMSPALASELRHGYDLVAIQWRSVEGLEALKRVRDHARTEGSVCAEGLAAFGMAQASRNIHVADALPLYHSAETLLAPVATPLTITYVHQRIASTEHAVGNNPAFLRDDAKIREDLHANGDAAGAIVEQSVAYQWGTEVELAENQGKLFEALKTIEAPNVIAARGVVEWEWGSILRRTGEMAKSMEHFRKAQVLLKQCDCVPSTQGTIELEMAMVADTGSDADAVLAHARAGDRIYRQYHLDLLRPQALKVMAFAYLHQHDLPEAISTLETALQLAREQHAGFAIHSLGSVLAGAYGDAGQPLRGIEVLQATRPEKPLPQEQCTADARLQSLQNQAKMYDTAVATAVQTLAQCKELLAPLDYYNLAWNLSDSELHVGRLNDALQHARDGVAGVELQRAKIEPNDRNLTAFTAKQSEAYVALINVLVRMNRVEDALLASEQYRARAFLDLAGSREAQQASGASAVTTAEELKSEAHAFTLTMADIRKTVEAQHSTLVSYWLTGEGDLYTWVMAPGKPVFQSVQTAPPARVAELVKATLPAEAAGTRGARVLTRGGQSEVVTTANRKPWRDLYDLLIAPIASQLPQEPGSLLTIVPQGPLFGLSFAALLSRDRRYLIEQYAISTVPSAGVLQVTARNEAAATGLPAKYLLVANPTAFPLVDGHPLPPLPGTALEVRGISQELNGKSVTVLQGRRAGVDSMKEQLASATTLHLATHAVVRDDAPMASFLALDRAQRGGMLTTAAVYGLKLHTNLVVLSACGTGKGTITGDGVAGLSRAFLYAGAASLVTTLWDVVDTPTARLMPKFYAGLARGESRSTALRQAQLGLIHDLRLHRLKVATLAGGQVSLPESPAYWAAFSLSGQP